MRSTPWFRFTWASFMFTSSETRSPVAYSTSSMVRSRCPSGSLTVGAANRASTSSSMSDLGRLRPTLGMAICAVGSSRRKPSRTRWRKNRRKARELARGRAGPGTRLHAGRHERKDVATLGDAEVDVVLFEPAIESREVRAIGSKCIGRQAALHPDRIEEPIDGSWTCGRSANRRRGRTWEESRFYCCAHGTSRVRWVQYASGSLGLVVTLLTNPGHR